MVLLPRQYAGTPVAQLLESAAYGTVGRDHRWVSAILDQDPTGDQVWAYFEQADPEVREVLAEDVLGFLDFRKHPKAVEAAVASIRNAPSNVDDGVMEAVFRLGEAAVEPLLELTGELDEEDSGDVLFLLSGLGVRDERIKELLLEQLEFRADEGALALATYGDPDAIPAIEAVLGQLDLNDPDHVGLKEELEEAIDRLRNPETREAVEPPHPSVFYDEIALPEFEDFEDEELLELFSCDDADLRAGAAGEFFQREYGPDVRDRLIALTNDPDSKVRSAALMALAEAAEEESVMELLLARLADADRPAEERAAAAVGLHTEMPGILEGKPEVRQALLDLAANPPTRARAIEAMWRSLDRSFGDLVASHLEDGDAEVRKQAILGVGFLQITEKVKRLEEMFSEPAVREDALYAYALAVPAEVSRGRVRSLLRKISELAGGLSEDEEEMLSVALDERLMMQGMKPVFQSGEGEESVIQ